MTVFLDEALPQSLVRPVLLKLGGSVITDKAGEAKFKKPACKRLLGELKRAQVPAVLFHGAGSFGHPAALRHGLGSKPAKPEGVAEVLAQVCKLHAEVLAVAQEQGLKPLSFPLHHTVSSAGGQLEDLPVARLLRALEEGYTPVLSGTLVRDAQLGWRVASADELMADLAPELDPRLAVFCSDVDGVMGPGGVMDSFGRADLDQLHPMESGGADVTGRMAGKLERAFEVAACCPTWILSGEERGRVQDVLKGKQVVGTRIEID